jgi:hypothetical protein
VDEPLRDSQGELLELVQREHSISMMRSQLHRRIEFLRGTGLFEPGSTELLAQLEAQERELSVQRRELHREIDRLRGKPGGPSGRSQPD